MREQRLQRRPGTVVVQRLQLLGVLGDESVVVDEVAEDRSVGDERRRVLVLLPRQRNEGVFQLVDDLDRLALLVDALGVACPTGDDGGGKCYFPAGFEIGAESSFATRSLLWPQVRLSLWPLRVLLLLVLRQPLVHTLRSGTESPST